LKPPAPSGENQKEQQTETKRHEIKKESQKAAERAGNKCQQADGLKLTITPARHQALKQRRRAGVAVEAAVEADGNTNTGCQQ
jgi:hypothetical protein